MAVLVPYHEQSERPSLVVVDFRMLLCMKRLLNEEKKSKAS